MNKTLIVGSMLLIVSSFVLGFVGLDQEITGETLCVDGMNRINLEGIMCEEKTVTWFGNHSVSVLLMLIPAILGLYFFYLGLNDVGEQAE